MSKDVKLLAKNLGKKAKDLGVELSHSQSLELLAFTKGYADWNAYSAELKNEKTAINSNDKGYSEVAQQCINLVHALNNVGGLSHRAVIEISEYMKIDASRVDEILEETSEYVDKKKQIELDLFYKKFQKQGLNVFEFVINEESFYIVAKNLKEAEFHAREDFFKHDSVIETINFEKILTFDQLMEYQFYDDNYLDVNPSFLEKLSKNKDVAPYVFARSDGF